MIVASVVSKGSPSSQDSPFPLSGDFLLDVKEASLVVGGKKSAYPDRRKARRRRPVEHDVYVWVVSCRVDPSTSGTVQELSTCPVPFGRSRERDPVVHMSSQIWPDRG